MLALVAVGTLVAPGVLTAEAATTALVAAIGLAAGEVVVLVVGGMPLLTLLVALTAS